MVAPSRFSDVQWAWLESRYADFCHHQTANTLKLFYATLLPAFHAEFPWTSLDASTVTSEIADTNKVSAF
jgi:hypothetical protein